MKKTKVVIWGVDDYNVLGLYRELGGMDLDIEFIVFQGVRNCGTLSKYCTKHISIPTLEDGLKYLLDNYTDAENKAVIICSNDLIAECLDENRDRLSPYFVVPGTSVPGSLTMLDDKAVMTNIATELGITVPKSITCTWNSSVEGVQYPCLLKPTHQTLGHYNEFKYRICKNERSLKRTLKYVRKESTFILQQYIPRESVALVYGCRTLDGQVHLAGVLEKDRFCDNGDGSHGVLLDEFPSYIEEDKVVKFIEKADYYGLFSVEFVVSQGQAYFLEVNWRNDGTSHLFYQAGANLPLLWVLSSTGNDISSICTRIVSRSYFIDEIFDDENVKKGYLSRKQWEEEFMQATVFKYKDDRDPAPYEAVLKGKRKKLFIDSIVSKNRLYIVYILDKLGLKRK